MKAPARVHNLLLTNGYGYRDDAYLAFTERPPVVKNIQFQRGEEGLLIDVGLFYPDLGDAAAGMTPREATTLRTDGILWFGPWPVDETQSRDDLYFPAKDVDRLYKAVEEDAFEWLLKLSNGDLMISLIDALMGLCDLPEPFRYMSKFRFLDRKVTVGRLKNKVAYLNYLGDFDKALVLLEDDKLKHCREEPFGAKLLRDAQERNITVSAGFIDYMRQGGARIPQNVRV